MDNFHTIKLPPEDFTYEKYGLNRFPPLWEITPKSPIKYRKYLEEFAYYFKREEHYDFVQYQATDKDFTARCYLFSERYSRWVGGICFRRRDYEIEGWKWSLDWVWVHPYKRRNGILSKHWPYFIETFKSFIVSWPISPAMNSFLIKHNNGSLYAGDPSLFVNPESGIKGRENAVK